MSGSPDCSLLALAHLVDEGHVHHPVDVSFYVVHDPPDVELGVRDLEPEVHPCVALEGLRAPTAWDAFGVRVHGRAHFLDDPRAEPEAIVSTYLLDRTGRSVSLLRRGDEVTELSGPAVGRIPDLCRSILDIGPHPAAIDPTDTDS